MLVKRKALDLFLKTYDLEVKSNIIQHLGKGRDLHTATLLI